MAGFSFFESSRARGRPVTLYLFTHGEGPTSFFAYNDSVSAIEFGDPAVTYEPLPISHGALRSSGTLDKSTLELRMPSDAGLAELFLVWPPTQPVSLVIRKGHAGDADKDFRARWSGRVLGGGFEGSEAVFSCEPLTTSMRRNGLRRHWQRGCPHVLYSEGVGLCNADKAAATIETTASAIEARTITVPVDWGGAAEAAQFHNGMVEWTTAAGNVERRTILRVTDGRTFLLSGLVRDLAVDDAVSVIKGCPHTMPGCTEVHDNILNFGGQNWIPGKSPFSSRNEFY